MARNRKGFTCVACGAPLGLEDADRCAPCAAPAVLAAGKAVRAARREREDRETLEFALKLDERVVTYLANGEEVVVNGLGEPC